MSLAPSLLRSCAAVVLIALSGCATSPENHYYVLSPTADAAAALDTAGNAAPPHLSVTLPAYLDRPQMVFVAADGSADIREFERWAEPLDGMVKRVLAQDIRAQKNLRTNAQTITVTFDTFAFGNGQAVLKAHWTIGANPEKRAKTVQTYPFAASLSAASDPVAMANAMSALLGSLAQSIAASLS